MKQDRFLLSVVFISGMSIMAVEMSASRLLAPYFGTSLFVWTNIIGVIMIALSIGYYVGGKLSDRHPDKRLLYKIILAGSVLTALIPFVAKPIMALSVRGINESSISLFYVSLFATITLFAIPLTLLGMVSPFAIRVSSREINKVGNTAGSIYALSTVGSIIGTFIPALLTIPFIGTKNTILLFAFLLTLLSVIGLKKKMLFVIPLAVVALSFVATAIKPTDDMVYEDESLYHYIQVIEKNGWTYLKLNEGHAIHSKYNPDYILANGEWDYFNILPVINKNAQNALIIGLAAGTVAREYSSFFPSILMEGIEIDSKVIEAGKKYFDMNEEQLTAHVMDGRIFLQTTDKRYDLVIIDAYRQPYIPFHLTTKEFFQLVRGRMNNGGVMAINVGSTSEDSEVLMMIRNTVKSVYKNVYEIKVPASLNYIVIATDYDYSLEGLDSDGQLKGLISYFTDNYRVIDFDDNALVLTDDKAPVEVFTDKMILGYALQS